MRCPRSVNDYPHNCPMMRHGARRVAAGEPQVYSETSELFVAQMLNLDLIDALSFSKGCYTGQEIITRTQHLGRIKRRMLAFRFPPGIDARRGEPVTLGRIVRDGWWRARAMSQAGWMSWLSFQ